VGVAPLEQNLLNEAPHWRATLRIMGCVCCWVCWCAGRGCCLPPPFLARLAELLAECQNRNCHPPKAESALDVQYKKSLGRIFGAATPRGASSVRRTFPCK
jgi:hypothetical protein